MKMQLRCSFCAVVASLLLVSSVSLTLAAKEQEIFLPADCDVLKIVGNGFKLELSQFDQIKRDFQQVAEESAQVEVPRDSDNSKADNREPVEEKVVSNEHLFEEAASEAQVVDYGELDESLKRWIDDRATTLMNRIQRYEEELAAVQNGPQRIVLDILLLNTLVDLDNLIKEKVVHLRWVDNKLQKLLTTNINKELKLAEVREFVVSLIDQNQAIEVKVVGKNEPGKVWVQNTQTIKRVLHEQRFSEALSRLIVEFLAGKFNLMKRSVVYEINRQPRQLDDGLYYAGARGRVPADFPFTAQDAISHGVYK